MTPSIAKNNIFEQQTQRHDYRDLIMLFDQTFAPSFNTRLVKGDDEPVYLPADDTIGYHRIIFAHGFFASALHEIAHWCVAGPKRRLLEDFGYWYLPDGRNKEQQAQFETVEIKPQAVEWALSMACNKRFDVSVDNLTGEGQTDRFEFRKRVLKQVQRYCQHGFPPQAETLLAVLATFYGTTYPLTFTLFEQAQAEFVAEHITLV